jgi:hypothetical protein
MKRKKEIYATLKECYIALSMWYQVRKNTKNNSVTSWEVDVTRGTILVKLTVTIPWKGGFQHKHSHH